MLPTVTKKNDNLYNGVFIWCPNNGTYPKIFPILAGSKNNSYNGTYPRIAKYSHGHYKSLWFSEENMSPSKVG